MPAKRTAPAAEHAAGDAAQPAVPADTVIELVSEQDPADDGDKPLPGGWYINTSVVDLVLLQPPALLRPARVIELEFGVRHRDLRPATDAEVEAAHAAETAEQAAAEHAAGDATSGQE